ncbi:hypothetical protein [Ruania alba]|uniref:Uncharacterized protein n=1 Tax=Ruania alba TaxID=648782 RepID=A0A1H5G5D5_9MICO|nr:hypothetical protein [Ruania alba]SEE10900.1 hypothetical protein SAMN04488554_1545 [Ruania alba]
MDELHRAASEIYAVPPEEFVATRDGCARQLDASGSHDAAAQVRGLAKPVRAAWAVNVLVRRMPERVAQLTDLGRALREAHERMDAVDLRELTVRRRTLVTTMVRELRSLCRELGPDLSGATCTQVEQTLVAGVADEQIEAAVLSGLLVRPFGPGGASTAQVRDATAVPGATGVRPTAQRPGSPLVVVPDPEPPARRATSADRRAAAAEVRAAQRRVQRLESAAERAQEGVASYQAEALRLRAEIEELRRRAFDLEHQAERADRELHRADQTRSDAVRTLEEAQDALADARAQEQALGSD